MVYFVLFLFLFSISYNFAFFKISFFNSETKTPLSSVMLQSIILTSHYLLKTLISSASDLISLVRNLIDIFILSFKFFLEEYQSEIITPPL